MTAPHSTITLRVIALSLSLAVTAHPQEPGVPVSAEQADPAPQRASAFDGPPPPFGPGGPRGMGPMRQEVKLVEKFDQDGNKRLSAGERKAAREFLAKERAEGRLGRGPGRGPAGGPGGPPGAGPGGPGEFRGGPFGRRESQPPPQPGAQLTPADVRSYPAMPLYDSQTLRTLFFQFENADWEKELADFHDTDVEVPATLTVDGKSYRDVGVHFRGMSSYMMVGEGHKRSLGVSIDFAHDSQRLGGYRSLDLLNSHEDPTFLRAVLYSQIAREYLPAAKANFVRVVINGESWGLYVNAQPFNKDFVEEWFGTKKGARWKAPGSPMGAAGLEYLGDDAAEYKKRFEIKSKDDPKAWTDLIQLCRVLNETPADRLEKALAPLLDIDGALKFLALENVFINGDGYWVRSSDYSLYEDEKGCFHIIPHDVNETFSVPGGPGFGPGPGNAGRGPGRGLPGGGVGQGRTPRVEGVALDPLTGADNAKKPLLSKLLAVPALRSRYLGFVRDIAEQWLDWNRLAPIVQQYQTLIADDVRADTRKLESTDAFEKGIAGDSENSGAPGPRREISLKSFADQRRAYLLKHPALQTEVITSSTPVANENP